MKLQKKSSKLQTLITSSLWYVYLLHTPGPRLTTSREVEFNKFCPVLYCKKPQLVPNSEKTKREKERKKKISWGKLCIYLCMGSE